jgi:hypothetical protein
MSPAASAARYALFVQAAVTLVFGLLRPGSSTAWTIGTVALAMGAVGLGAALAPTRTTRTAILGFEGFALVFSVLGLAAGHYVPGTVIGLHLLVKLLQTPADEFAEGPVAAVPLSASLSAAVPAAPAPEAPPPPWGTPAAQPVPAAALVSVSPEPAPAVPFAAPFGAPGATPWQRSAPFLPPQPGSHPAGRTVVPVVPQQPMPVPVEAPPAEVSASTLEDAVRALGEASPAVPRPVAPVAVPVPAPPTVARACMTILPG